MSHRPTSRPATGPDGGGGPGIVRTDRRRAAASLPALLVAGVLAAWPPGRARAQASAGAVPPPLPPGCERYPFELQLDLDDVTRLVHTPPDRLLAAIRQRGIDVLRVPVRDAAAPRNPLLVRLPVAAPELLARAAFLDGYQGRAIPRGSACCDLPRDTVLVREDAPTWTLLHEVLHLRLVPADGRALRDDVELRFDTALHRLTVYQRRLYDDPWRLLQPAWRRDILEAQRDAAALLHERLRIGQSQEVVIEHVLRGCIVDGSPYFDARRREDGRRYGLAMVDNAVDVFNTIHASLVFGRDTVRQLREELAGAAAGVRLEPTEHLSSDEASSFAAEVETILRTLEPTREAIEALKRLYERNVRDGALRTPRPAASRTA